MREKLNYIFSPDPLYEAQRERTLEDYRGYFPPEEQALHSIDFLQSLLIIQASGGSHGTTYHTIYLELPGGRGRMKGICQFSIRQNKHPKAPQYFAEVDFFYTESGQKENAIAVAQRALPRKPYPQAGKNNQALLKAARAATLSYNSQVEIHNVVDGLQTANGMYQWPKLLAPPPGWIEPTQAQFRVQRLPYTQYLEEVEFHYAPLKIKVETPLRWQLPEGMQFTPCTTFQLLF